MASEAQIRVMQASRAMLKALKALTRRYDHDWKDRMAAAHAAIAQAEAAGIAVSGSQAETWSA